MTRPACIAHTRRTAPDGRCLTPVISTDDADKWDEGSGPEQGWNAAAGAEQALCPGSGRLERVDPPGQAALSTRYGVGVNCPSSTRAVQDARGFAECLLGGVRISSDDHVVDLANRRLDLAPPRLVALRTPPASSKRLLRR